MMELGVVDRLFLLQIIPKEGNATQNKLIREVMDDVGFTEVEVAQLTFVNHPDGRTTWDPEAAKDCRREFEFGPEVYRIIKEQLQKLDSNNALPMDAMGLWEKFIEDTKLAVVPREAEEEPVEIPGE